MAVAATYAATKDPGTTQTPAGQSGVREKPEVNDQSQQDAVVDQLGEVRTWFGKR